MTPPEHTSRAAPAAARLARYTLPAALLLGWLIMLPLLWRAFTTVPSAERLRESRMVQIPTLETVIQQVGLSAVELGVALLLAWPGRRALSRLWVAAIGAWAWFLATTPLGLSTVQWVHRRWLAATALLLLAAALGASTLRLVRRTRTRAHP